MSKLRWGFIGCGRISAKHFEALQQLSDKISVVAVCDVDSTKAQKAAEIFKCNYYTDIQSMLDSEELDIVTIATPNGLHPEHSIMCARAGVDVLCEKPMSVKMEDAYEVESVFKELKRNFFLVHQNRYNDTVVALKKAIEQGRFGKIYMMLSNVLWQRPQDYYDKEAWHGTKDLDGGAFMTQASHYVDMLNWLAHSKATRVFASLGTLARNIETEDTGSTIINWENGIIGNINMTVLTYPKNLEGSITILGEKGTVKIGGVALNEISHWEFEGSDPSDELVKNAGYKTDSVYGFGHVRTYENILKFYDGNKGDIVSLESALLGMRLLDAIIKSDTKKEPIAL